jgi:hypothetical protein
MRDKVRLSRDMFLSDDLVFAGYFAMRRKRLLTHATNLFSHRRGDVSMREIGLRSTALHRTPSDGSSLAANTHNRTPSEPLEANQKAAQWARYWDILDSGNMPRIPTDGTAPAWPAGKHTRKTLP